MTTSNHTVEFADVTKAFERDDRAVTAVRDVTLQIGQGEFVCIVGPSGCGKSTLLNMAAGIMRTTAGSVYYNGALVKGPNPSLGYVTQKDHLLPWRSVTRNISLALELRQHKRREDTSSVEEMIELVGLEGFEDHFPAELSGGMRKRVTLARTLIYNPDSLLMDEPFGALDAQLKIGLQAELLRIWREKGMTIVFVTHDLNEALTLADRVVVLTGQPGRVRHVEHVGFARPRVPGAIQFTDDFTLSAKRLWDLLMEKSSTLSGGEDAEYVSSDV